MLFEWANNREVRKMAFSSDPVEWLQHMEWFENKLKDPASLIYIALNERDEPVAQIRFDLESDRAATVDVHTKPGFRGKGIGTETIVLGVNHCFRDLGVDVVHAIIKHENVSSKKAFKKAGFREFTQKTVQGHRVYHLIKERI